MDTGLIIRAFLEQLRRTQFQPSKWLVEHQRRLLEPLVRHARRHVPFYRDSGRLAPLFRRDDSIDWNRWSEVPLLKRKDVQTNFEAMKSEVLPPEQGNTWTLSTSGSTGEPVKVVHTTMAGRVAWAAQLLRDLERHRIDPTRRLVFLHPSTRMPADGVPPRKRAHWYSGLDDVGLFGERFDLTDTQPAAALVDRVADLQPTYLRVQPIALQLMCANDDRRRLAELNIETVMTVGDQFPFDAKREVAMHLGCRIMDHYASEECGRIATTCPGCARFHVDAEVNLVEVIGDDGASTPAGETGWLIVTPLYNYAMPLLRYDHADQARVGQPDQCRITLPALDEVFGKERDPFRFPNGDVIRPTLSAKAVVEYIGAQAYQVVQVAPDRCEVRIVQGSKTLNEMQTEAMTQHLRSVWWKGLNVDYRIVETLPRRSSRGKLPLFVNEFDNVAKAATIP